MAASSYDAKKYSQTFRRYRIRRALLYVGALLTGIFVAWAERRCWLPCFFTRLFVLRGVDSYLIGPCIAQTLALPLLMLAGLRRTSYYHVSKGVNFVFWFLHGVALSNSFCLASPTLLLLLPLCLWLAMLLMHADSAAAAGINRTPSAPGTSAWSYISLTLRLWGAALIAQFLFYWILATMA